MKHHLTLIVLAALLGLSLAVAAQAVSPRSFVEDSPEAYTQGAGENIIWDQHGALQLGRDMQVVLRDQRPGLDYVTAMTAAPDGSVYAVGGNEGHVFRIRGGRAEQVATLQDPVLFSIAAAPDGTLYVGSGGTNARIWRIGPDGKTDIFFRDPTINYYWSLTVTPAGRLLAATGAGGKLLNISPDGKANVLLETEQKHLRSLYLSPTGDVYVGTDGQAVLYRINRQGNQFVIHHGQQSEITAITGDQQGNIYFAAATPTGAPGAPADEFPSIQSLTLSRFIGEEAAKDDDAAEPDGQPEDNPDDNADDAPDAQQPPADDGDQQSQDADNPADRPAGTGSTPAGTSSRSQAAAPATALEPALGREDEQVQNHAEPGAGDNPGNHADDGPAPGKSQGDADSPAPEASTPAAGQHDNSVASPASPTDNGDDESPKPGPQSPATPAAAKPAARTAAPGRAATAAGAGNAVYRVSPDGLVRKLYSTGEGMLLALLVDDRQLLVGSTVAGQIIAINLQEEGVAAVARTETKQVSALARADDGTVLIGTAGPGAVYRLQGGLVPRGGYLSKVHDAGMSARFGRIDAVIDVPQGTRATFSTRSGNVPEPDDNTWSQWSPEISAGEKISSPPARYIQFRVSLFSAGNQTPVIHSVNLIYLQGNQPPAITKFDLGPKQEQQRRAVGGKLAPGAETPAPAQAVNLVWQASDPNEDDLRYSLYARPAEGHAPWVMIESDLIESRYQWQTAAVAEGKYQIMLKVTDAADNVPGEEMIANKVLGPILVDNRQPEILNFVAQQQDDSLRIRATVRDSASNIVAVRYSVDGQRNWRPLPPVDGICDSRQEEINTLVPLPQPGTRVINLQTIDEAGNSTTSSVNVPIIPPAPNP